MDWVWSYIQSNNSVENQNFLVIFKFINERPEVSRIPPGAEVFLCVGAGVAAGLVGGAILGSLFGTDNDKDIKELNNNILKVDKKIHITNARLIYWLKMSQTP
mgnify:CR=1 FL=1